MKILHYALGFPPYRSGGMTKFCMDLMKQQSMDGHQVALMWPGQMNFFLKRISVKDRGIVKIHGINSGIRSFEVINPLPISYDEGIRDFSDFTRDGGGDMYDALLDRYKPDVIHVHTLMGLHRSFLSSAKAREIRLIFTAHDFFPICPKVTMFRHGAICDGVQSCDECGICNASALRKWKIWVLQSPVYRVFKDCAIVKRSRKRHRDRYLSESIVDDAVEAVGSADDFKCLRGYYHSLLRAMDVIHYNSSITKIVYEKVFELSCSCVISITHSDVADRKKIKEFSGSFLRIRYLGPYGASKGFFYSRRHLINFGMKEKIFA